MPDRISNSPANSLANTILKDAGTGLWIVSGESGSGKTTFCVDILERARQSNLSVGGLLCPAVFLNEVKVGIDQVDISSGDRRRLGMRSFDENVATVGCWQMDEAVISWGNEILNLLQDEDVIIIDEVGPLEFESGFGYQQALHLLDEGRYRTALVVVRPTLLAQAQSRWPGAQILILEKHAS